MFRNIRALCPRSSLLRRCLQQVPNRIHVPLALIVAIGLISSLIVPTSGRASERKEGQSGEDLLERARENRETLSASFPGFRSKLIVRKDGRIHEGQMLFRPPITLEIQLDDRELLRSVKSTVRSLLSHRMASNRSSTRKSESITLAEPDNHPLGRRIFLGDRYGSSYRIQNDRILEVDRNMDDDRLLITVMETQETSSGNYLPTHFFVSVFDKQSGSVEQASAYADAYREIGGNYLPESRKVVSTADGKTEILLVEWDEMELLSPQEEP